MTFGRGRGLSVVFDLDKKKIKVKIFEVLWYEIFLWGWGLRFFLEFEFLN